MVAKQSGTATLENNLVASQKVKHTPAIFPSLPLLDIYQRERNAYIHRKTYI